MLHESFILLSCLAGLLAAIFIIRRHLIFKKYIQESHIPFIKVSSYISGSFHAINNSRQSIAERVDKYFKLKGNTYGVFMGEVPYIFTKDLDLIYKLWVLDSYKYINRPFLGAMTGYNDTSLMQARDDTWRKARRAIGSTMTHSKLKMSNVELDIEDSINKLMTSLEKYKRNNDKGLLLVDCSSMFKKFIMDLFMKVGFGQTNLVDYDSDDNKIVSMAGDVVKKAVSPVVIWTIHLNSLTPIILKIIQIFKLNHFVEYLYNILDVIINKFEHVKSSGDKSEIRMIHSLIDLYKTKKLTRDELKSNTFFMLMAGWDTTSDSLTALMWHLAMNSNVQDKLREEIIKNGSESEYLLWTIKESIRLFSPASTARVITEDFIWKGYKIMKGMAVVMQNYSLMRDTNIWGQDALEFKPERFDADLINNSPSDYQHHPARFSSFGLGPRNCVGYQLAILEMKFTTYRLLMKYKIRPTRETATNLRLKEGSGTVFFANILKDKILLEFEPIY